MDTMLTGNLKKSSKNRKLSFPDNKYLYKTNEYIKPLPSNSLTSMKTHIKQHISDELVLASVLLSAAQRPTCVHVHMHVG